MSRLLLDSDQPSKLIDWERYEGFKDILGPRLVVSLSQKLMLLNKDWDCTHDSDVSLVTMTDPSRQILRQSPCRNPIANLESHKRRLL